MICAILDCAIPAEYDERAKGEISQNSSKAIA